MVARGWKNAGRRRRAGSEEEKIKGCWKEEKRGKEEGRLLGVREGGGKTGSLRARKEGKKGGGVD